jgi:hypothetical protein
MRVDALNEAVAGRALDEVCLPDQRIDLESPLDVLERLARLEALLDRLQREQTPNYRAAWAALHREHAALMRDSGLSFRVDEAGDYWLTHIGRPILFIRHQGAPGKSEFAKARPTSIGTLSDGLAQAAS